MIIEIEIPEESEKLIARLDVNEEIPLALFFDSGKGVEFLIDKNGKVSKATTIETPFEMPFKK